MPSPVQGNQQQSAIPLPENSEQQGAAGAESVGLGYDDTTSVSHRSGSDTEQFAGSAQEQAPTIPTPVPGATASPGDLKGQYIQHHASQIRLELMGGIETIKVTNPELVTPELLLKQQLIETKLANIESAPQEVVDSLHRSAIELSSSAMSGSLTSDKLDEIIAQLQTKLEDNSVKFQQEKIEISSQAAQQQHDSNVDEIRKGIEKHNNAKKNKGLFALKIIASIFIPPLGFSEALKAIDREVFGVDNGTSMFSSQDAINNRKIRENMANDVGLTATPPEAPQLPDERQRLDEEHRHAEEERESDPISDATEGLDLGMNNAEFMKLLQQINESEEAKEKLEEALAALEAGDPELAAAILDGSADGSDTESEAGDSGFGDDENQLNDLGVADFEPPSIEASDRGSEGVADLQPVNEFSDFMDQMSSVPQATMDSQADSLREQAMIQRGNFA